MKSKQKDKQALFKKIAPVVLFLILVIFVIIVFSNYQDQNPQLQGTNSGDEGLIKTEIDLPSEEINVERESDTCAVKDSTQLPDNWPNDLPAFETTLSLNSSCLSDSHSGFRVEMIVAEAYSYLTFGFIQDLKMMGWEFTTDTPDLEPKTNSVDLEAEKDNRRLTLKITKLDEINGQAATQIVMIESY